ncbi:MAG: 5-amino-6-(D-ribitylamino)uracil--L-tyrosine 4-hydroxyphenyl transferase CofH [Verrucomicrobiota bacterium]
MNNTRVITYSSSITATLTHDCPWSCSYCGFRTMHEGLISESKIHDLISQAKQYGAREALIISGENPELFAHIRQQLQERGFKDFIDFTIYVADLFTKNGLLPHSNIGALNCSQLKRLRPHFASMGLMLENIYHLPEVAPQKTVAERLQTIESAGRLNIPFTSGILIGVGESPQSRLDSLDALAELHHNYGHLQEILIQNFIPNTHCSLTSVKAPELDEYITLIDHWKKVSPDVAIQIPPNLNPYWRELLPYIQDLGGISTNRDEVNQQSPWQSLTNYRRIADPAKITLKERLAVYDHYINEAWMDPQMLKAAMNVKSSESFSLTNKRCLTGQNDNLWKMPTDELILEADCLNKQMHGDVVTYVHNRNANFTNICYVGCSFCGFQRTKSDDDCYTYSPQKVVEQIYQTPEVTEVCLQGGINPELELDYYLELIRSIREAFPKMHIHAFSPMEIHSLHKKSEKSYYDILQSLMEVGLNSIPGTAAEILVDDIRKIVSGNKLTTSNWREIVTTAHRCGLPSTCTVMFNHIETWENISQHFDLIKDIQLETGGFTEFIPLSFIPYNNRLGQKMSKDASSKEAWFLEHEQRMIHKAKRIYPLARIYFKDLIPNLQTSWVKLGKELALESLNWGCNDFGGTLYQESITSASGGRHGTNMRLNEIKNALSSAGKRPYQRNTLYDLVSPKVDAIKLS